MCVKIPLYAYKSESINSEIQQIIELMLAVCNYFSF